jgi:serralysin
MGGNDVIIGRGGNDLLDGGAGKDRMTGGAGADTFVFRRVLDSPAARPDVITDFKAGQGDKFDLSKKQRFTEYLGARPFTRKAGQLRFDRTRNRLEGDTTGDGRANFRVVLQGVTRLPARAIKLR